MPKNEVSDLITDQEIAFVHLIVSGNMTDQRAAAAVGLNPTTAAYIKSKPCVRAYMLEHRARMQQQLVEQETAPRFHLGREQVLDRLWELAILGPEVTRGSITGQVKAISMIVAIEGLIPDRRPAQRRRTPLHHPTNRSSINPLGVASSRRKPTAPSPTPSMTRNKMKLAFSRPNPPAALSLTPASPPSPMARA